MCLLKSKLLSSTSSEVPVPHGWSIIYSSYLDTVDNCSLPLDFQHRCTVSRHFWEQDCYTIAFAPWYPDRNWLYTLTTRTTGPKHHLLNRTRDLSFHILTGKIASIYAKYTIYFSLYLLKKIFRTQSKK